MVKSKLKIFKKKILKDNILGLVNPRIHNLCNKVGIRRVGGLVYEEIRGIVKTFLENFLRQVITVTGYYRRNTIGVNDIYLATENHLLLNQKNIPKCKKTNKMQICLEFARAPFERLVREISQDFKIDVRFEEASFELIQYYTERYLLEILNNARLEMIHDKRDTLQPKDLQIVQRIQSA